MIGISKLVALSPNAHTRLYLFRVRTIMNNLPLGIYWFGNDLHITAAPGNYSKYLGAKIIAINNVPNNLDISGSLINDIFILRPPYRPKN